MFWTLGKYLLKHVVFKWHKMSYHLLRSVDLRISILMVRRGRPNLKTWSKFSPCWSVPLREATLGGMSERPVWYPAPSHYPSPSLSLPSVSSSTSPFCHLLLLLRCASSCAVPSDRIERNTWGGGKKELIRKPVWSEIWIFYQYYIWLETFNVLECIGADCISILSDDTQNGWAGTVRRTFFSFKGLIIRDLNFLNNVS